MVNDRTGGSEAFNIGEGKSIGAESFKVGLELKQLDSDPKSYYAAQMASLQNVDSKATLDFQLSQSADAMKGTVIFNGPLQGGDSLESTNPTQVNSAIKSNQNQNQERQLTGTGVYDFS